MHCKPLQSTSFALGMHSGMHRGGILEAKKCIAAAASVCCPAWFHCKPRRALCSNSALLCLALPALNSTLLSTLPVLPTECKKAGDKSSFCLSSPGSSDLGVERCMLQVSNTLPITLLFNTLPITLFFNTLPITPPITPPMRSHMKTLRSSTPSQ